MVVKKKKTQHFVSRYNYLENEPYCYTFWSRKFSEIIVIEAINVSIFYLSIFGIKIKKDEYNKNEVEWG